MNMCITVSVSYWLMHMVHQPCWLQLRDRQKSVVVLVKLFCAVSNTDPQVGWE